MFNIDLGPKKTASCTQQAVRSSMAPQDRSTPGHACEHACTNTAAMHEHWPGAHADGKILKAGSRVQKMLET